MIGDNYPVGMSLCDSEGMAGNCGIECRGYTLGECPIQDEIDEIEIEIKMSDLSLGRRISSDETNKADIAITYLMLHDALSHLDTVLIPPPNFDEGEVDEVLLENRWEEESEIANREVNRLASEIYLALTGKHPVRDHSVRYDEEIPF